jgi:antitoxin VapB
MALSIKNKTADALARELAKLKNMPITEAVVDELRRGVERERQRPRTKQDRDEIYEKLMEIGRRASALPNLDPRHPDEILYDENGLPK